MGTCAGCALLAHSITDNTENVQSLQVMDMQVKRNAFGRQKESFEQVITINGLSTPYHAVFIRAPIIQQTWGGCEILSEIQNNIIAARQGCHVAYAFHPELTVDDRLHQHFIKQLI